MQKSIIGLAIFWLCGLALSYRDFPFDGYQSCDRGNWQCELGRQCSTCTISDNNQQTVVYKCDPDNSFEEGLCPNSETHSGGGWSCQCHGPAWNGRDASTGLITGVNLGVRKDDECHKDIDCADPKNPRLHRRCATCKFEAFGGDLFEGSGGDLGFFCVNPNEEDVHKKYCDKSINHGKCWCSELKSEEETGFEQASIGTADGGTSFDPINIKPAADYGEALLKPIDINNQAGLNPLFGNLEAAAPNNEPDTPVQVGFEQNDIKLSSNSFLNNDEIFPSDFFSNPTFGRKRRARSN